MEAKHRFLNASIHRTMSDAFDDYCKQKGFGPSAAVQQILYEKFKTNPKAIYQKAARFFEAKLLVAGKPTTQKSLDHD
jgi:hypothetical protein